VPERLLHGHCGVAASLLCFFNLEVNLFKQEGKYCATARKETFGTAAKKCNGTCIGESEKLKINSTRLTSVSLLSAKKGIKEVSLLSGSLHPKHHIRDQ
jgi:hypothetical protein